MKYSVYGIGNALVDIVTEVDDEFLAMNHIEKGLMTLVDEKRQLDLMQVIDMEKSQLSCGGSAGNTMIAVSQFGGKSFYSCLVASDDLGKFFLEDLGRNGVDTNLTPDQLPPGHSGRCLVMTSPDTQRTMNTFLGVSSNFSPRQIDEEAIKNAGLVYLEGYLVPGPDGLAAMKEAKKIAQKHHIPVSLTFSDPSMVKYFGDAMREIVGDGVDLLFCNEEEAILYTGSSSLEAAREELRKSARKFVITLGSEGALIFDGHVFITVAANKTTPVDSNGAGDMFAGAFIYGITHGLSYAEAGDLASLAASKIVAKWGPRLAQGDAAKILEELKNRRKA